MKVSHLFLLGVLGAFLTVSSVASAAEAGTNLVSNGTFEAGTDLELADGALDDWSRSGSNPGLCVVAFPVPDGGNHALAVNDDDTEGYAEWYTQLSLAGIATEGDALTLSWDEMYAIESGEMRVSLVFFDGTDAVVGQNHFVTNNFSDGWNSSPQDSTYTAREEPLIVPLATTRMTLSLVSGGSLETTGTMVIDNLCLARPKQPELLAGNFWPNPTFEEGTDLDDPDGTVSAWNRGGSDATIGTITGDASISPTHALAVIDNNVTGYGEWYADLELAGKVSAGGSLQVQWFELYSVSDGDAMRLSALFFNAEQAVISEHHFEVTGDSAGWSGSIADSELSLRNESLEVPAGATTLRMALVSGGSEATTGVMVIDDLSIAAPVAPQVLSGNFWHNPGFEEGAGLDAPDGAVTGWNRGGSLGTICEISTANSISPTHALAVVDESADGYGEWYADLALEGIAESEDRLNIQWFELFDISAGGSMRVSVLFLNAEGGVVGENHYETTGQSAGWTGDVASSTFRRSNAQTLVPAAAATLRVALVSGGSLETKGTMLIDDLSIALLSEGDLAPGNFWPNPTFELGARLDIPESASPQGWNRGGSKASIDQVTTENSVSPSHALAVIDNDESGYGEWYYPFDLTGHAAAGDELIVRWFEMYSTTGEMRLSLLFFDDGNTVVGEQHYTVSGDSDGWDEEIASSIFSLREELLVVPDDAVRLQIGLVSGGSETVTGTFVIDDLSIGNLQPAEIQIGTIVTDLVEEQFLLTWPSSPDRTYSVLFSKDLIDFSQVIDSSIPSGGSETSHIIDFPGPAAGYFRVVEEGR
ncbi:MAG: hypothetical protein ACI9R3_006123 [Verrucomicrobiales bacterium]|jgi:hypothetical protein